MFTNFSKYQSKLVFDFNCLRRNMCQDGNVFTKSTTFVFLFFLWTFGQLQIDYNINAYEQFARKTCSRKEEGKKIDSLNILTGAIQ